MHSEAYNEARKEFINCMVLFWITCFVSIFVGFKEWLPIMREEKRKEKQALRSA